MMKARTFILFMMKARLLVISSKGCLKAFLNAFSNPFKALLEAPQRPSQGLLKPFKRLFKGLLKATFLGWP